MPDRIPDEIQSKAVDEPIELAEVETLLGKTADSRPPMPEPPPVRLLAVADVTHLAAPGVERKLDEVYVNLLKFERADELLKAKMQVEPVLGGQMPVVRPAWQEPPLPALKPGGIRGPVYRAEKHRVCFEIREPLFTRDDLRPTLIEVPSLAILIEGLNDLEIEFTRQRGLVPGHDTVLFLDPAGNWLEIGEIKPI